MGHPASNQSMKGTHMTSYMFELSTAEVTLLQQALGEYGAALYRSLNALEGDTGPTAMMTCELLTQTRKAISCLADRLAEME
jgi:hypothetical protein